MNWLIDACKSSYAAYLRRKSPKNGSMTANEYRGLILQANYYSVEDWASTNGYKTVTVFAAIRGTRHGPIAKEIRRKIERLAK